MMRINRSAELRRTLEQSIRGKTKVSSDTYFRLLQGCIALKALGEGKQVHAHMLNSSSLKPNSCLWNCLMKMYTRCGALVEARAIFDKLVHRTADSWTEIMAAYVLQLQADQALALFCKCLQSGIKTSPNVFSCALSACGCLGALKQVELIHSCIIEEGHDSDPSVNKALAKMYCKCSCLQDGEHVLARLTTQA